jgi:hypothetical protein
VAFVASRGARGARSGLVSAGPRSTVARLTGYSRTLSAALRLTYALPIVPKNTTCCNVSLYCAWLGASVITVE